MADPTISKVNPDGTVDVISSGGNLMSGIPLQSLPEKLQSEARLSSQPVDLPAPAPVAAPPQPPLRGSERAGALAAPQGLTAMQRSILQTPAQAVAQASNRTVADAASTIAEDSIAENQQAAADTGGGSFVDVGLGGPATDRAGSSFGSLLGAGGGGPRTVTKTDTKTKRQVGSPEIDTAVQTFNDERRALLQTEAVSNADTAVKVRAAQLDGAARMEEVERVAAAEASDVKQRRKVFMAKRNAEMADAEDIWLNREVDPNRFWANKSTPSKIASIIGGLISGLGAGFAGKEDPFVKRFEQAVEQDIAAQQANINKAGQAARHLDGVMTRFAGVSDNELANVAASKAASLRLIRGDVEQAMEAAKGSDAEIRLQTTLQGLNVKIAEEDLAREEAEAGEETKRTDETIRTGGGGGEGGFVDGLTLAQALERGDLGIPGLRIVDEGAAAGIFADKPSYRKLRGTVKSMRRMQSALSSMLAIREGFKTELPGSKAGGKYRGFRNELIAQLNAVRNAGVVNEAEYARLIDEIPDLAPKFNDLQRIFGRDPTMNMLKGLQESISVANAEALATMGLSLRGAVEKATLPTTEAGENLAFGELK